MIMIMILCEGKQRHVTKSGHLTASLLKSNDHSRCLREISKCSSLLTNVGKQTHYTSVQWTCKLPNQIAAEEIIFISVVNY